MECSDQESNHTCFPGFLQCNALPSLQKGRCLSRLSQSHASLVHARVWLTRCRVELAWAVEVGIHCLDAVEAPPHNPHNDTEVQDALDEVQEELGCNSCNCVALQVCKFAIWSITHQICLFCGGASL
jgi:hypothetical protein